MLRKVVDFYRFFQESKTKVRLCFQTLGDPSDFYSSWFEKAGKVPKECVVK